MRDESWFGYDLARDKNAYASSAKEGTHPSNVNRAQMSEPWIAENNSFPQWWMVDLGEEMNVSGLMVKWFSDGLWYAYSVETSTDGEKWTHAIQGKASGQSTQPIRFDDTVLARYVKINVLSVSGGNVAGMYKVEVYGNKN